MLEASYYKKRKMSYFRKAVYEKKHVTFGFIGGSITDPRTRNRWSEYLVSNFIADHPDVIVDVENVAIGATGSDYAVFRVQEDLINKDCDVIFIEYAVNDNERPTEQRNASREGLIRKLLKGCEADLILTYTYMSDMLSKMVLGQLPETIAEFEVLGEYYNLSSVFMGNYAFDAVRQGLLRWEEWLPDGLHPENVGSRFYAQPVYALLQEALQDPDIEQNIVALPPLYPDNWEFAEKLPLDQFHRHGYWRKYRCNDRPLVDYILSTTCIGSSIDTEFVGTGVVLTLSFGWMSTDFRWKIDDGEWKVYKPRRPSWMSDYSWLNTITLIQNLPNEKHMIEIETLPPGTDGTYKGSMFEICNVGILK